MSNTPTPKKEEEKKGLYEKKKMEHHVLKKKRKKRGWMFPEKMITQPTSMGKKRPMKTKQ